MKKLLLMIFTLALGVSLSACNTIRGVGEDISAVGSGIDKAATSVQKKL